MAKTETAPSPRNSPKTLEQSPPETPADGPPTGTRATGSDSAGNPAAGNPAAGNPAAGNTAAGNPSAGNPSAGNPTGNHSPGNHPPGNHPPGNRPAPATTEGPAGPAAPRTSAPTRANRPRAHRPRPAGRGARPVAAPRSAVARFARRRGRDYARGEPKAAPEPVTPNPVPAARPDEAPATVGDLRTLQTEVRTTAGDLKALRKEVREDNRDLRNALDAHALRAEERTAASEKRSMDAIKDTGQELRAEIKDSEQELRAEIKDSEQRTMAAIAASEKRLLAAIAEVAGLVKTLDARTNERISRGEARQWWWNRVLLLPYLVAVGEVVRRLVSRLF